MTPTDASAVAPDAFAETTPEDQSVYLRGWAEWLQSSLIVTEAKESGIGLRHGMVGEVGFEFIGPWEQPSPHHEYACAAYQGVK